MTITDRAVYKTIHWSIETENDTYYVQCQEDDICDTWYISSDEEGSIDNDSEVGQMLRRICEADKIGNQI